MFDLMGELEQVEWIKERSMGEPGVHSSRASQVSRHLHR